MHSPAWDQPADVMTPPPGPPFSVEAHTHFAASLHAWREQRCVLIKQAAEQVGVAETTWIRWEKGQRFPSPAKLRLLAERVGVPICCFFYPAPGTCPHCP